MAHQLQECHEAVREVANVLQPRVLLALAVPAFAQPKRAATPADQLKVAPGFKVAVVGAAGGIGQSLSLLMKMNPLVSVLHLYDVVNTPGVTADVSHMDTSAVVRKTNLLPTAFDCDLPINS